MTGRGQLAVDIMHFGNEKGPILYSEDCGSSKFALWRSEKDCIGGYFGEVAEFQ